MTHDEINANGTIPVITSGTSRRTGLKQLFAQGSRTHYELKDSKGSPVPPSLLIANGSTRCLSNDRSLIENEKN
ncbi:MAG: hypothetical protein KKB91_00290 [Proteobacteria bacterium]|nr:hypothetical protein [Desulfocapsa sp.]MBU3943166.1 hypothetical protein [Pseudomonadota bacterium]MCG2745063.1 hypothetical protein [Desulfobacteraceae bacterium]MBU3984316.1 hypothetical protein [Pseudomonadota bacterium]MBU4030337.1 hypothetical protein [Pseudomonadota bacterium]